MIKITMRAVCVLAAATACAVLTACGSDNAQTDSSAKQPISHQDATSGESQHPASGQSPATVPIGEVSGNPKAASAVQPWANDLVGGDMDRLVGNCWTIEPSNARAMYADKDGILAALAQPGADGQFAVLWKGPVRTVSLRRSEIASGYACPRVYATGARDTLTDGDARYVVRRYLSRVIGKPVNQDDIESKYRLACAGSAVDNNPDMLSGSTGFLEGEMSSRTLASPDPQAPKHEVTVPVTNSAGVNQPAVFTVDYGSEGNCISNITR
ncbi:hypothetical protein [Nocardia sp. NPDC004604]|uniref:hypothetical protein n=1 Tax=Nocardia sp. NPDC004604 TaxID=3157013 RepID=UPI0033BF9F69